LRAADEVVKIMLPNVSVAAFQGFIAMALFHKQVTRYVDENGRQVRKSTPGARKKKDKSKVWTGRYRDANGDKQEVTLFPDKEASRQKLAGLVRKAGQAETGLVSSFDDAGKKPLAEHIEDWLTTLKARNRSANHIAKLGGYVLRTVAACGWKRLKNLSLCDAEKYLAERRETRKDKDGNLIPGLSIAASNDHVAALKNFGNWLIRTRPKRWPENPFSGMAKLNSEGDVRLERRPASSEELPKLLTAAANGKPFRGLTGEDRVALYLVATETGFRASELASLTVASLNLSAEIPTIAVEAAVSKRRRRDVQPIRCELAVRLKTWLAAKLSAVTTLQLDGHAATLAGNMERESGEDAPRRFGSGRHSVSGRGRSETRLPFAARHLRNEFGNGRSLAKSRSRVDASFRHQPHNEGLHESQTLGCCLRPRKAATASDR